MNDLDRFIIIAVCIIAVYFFFDWLNMYFNEFIDDESEED